MSTLALRSYGRGRRCDQKYLPSVLFPVGLWMSVFPMPDYVSVPEVHSRCSVNAHLWHEIREYHRSGVAEELRGVSVSHREGAP